jgi:hypothetical protein
MKFFLILILSLLSTIPVSAQVNTNLSNWFAFDGEPYLAVNQGSKLIAAWMQLQPNLKISLAVRSSTNSGNNWSNIFIVPNEFPSWGSADPSIAFAGDTAYLCYVSYKGAGTTDSGRVVVRKSTDGGITWGSSSIVRDISETPDLALDRPWICAGSNGYLYVTTMPPKWATPPGALHMKYSSDAGQTWSNDIIVSGTGFPAFHGSMGVMSVSIPGTLYICYATLQGLNPKLAVAKTTNDGQTFERYYITDLTSPGDSLIQGSYSINCDPMNSSNVNVYFIDKRFGDADVFMCRSTNAGVSWGAPVRVNNDTQGNGIVQDMSWSVWEANISLVAWRDRRNGVPGSSSPFDFYYAISVNGGGFHSNERISSVTSPWNAIGTSGNDFLGFAVRNGNILTAWADYRSGNWEIFFNRDIAPSVNPINTEIPAAYMLHNFPNPFNPFTNIRFDIPESGNVKIIIYDANGKEVQTLYEGTLAPGKYVTQWNASAYPSGIYFLKLEADGKFNGSGKIVLVK